MVGYNKDSDQLLDHIFIAILALLQKIEPPQLPQHLPPPRLPLRLDRPTHMLFKIGVALRNFTPKRGINARCGHICAGFLDDGVVPCGRHTDILYSDD